MNIKKLAMVVVAVGTIGVGVVGAQPPRPNRGGDGVLRALADVVLEATGLTGQELREELRDGSTMAQIIEANGGNVDATIDEVIAIITERVNEEVANGRLTQERADQLLATVEARVTEAMNGEVPLPLGRERHPVMVLGGLELLMDEAYEATGLAPFRIREQIREGATLGEIIAANGGNPDTVIADALATATDYANQAVEDERLTQEEANEILARLNELYNSAMQGALREQAEAI